MPVRGLAQGTYLPPDRAQGCHEQPDADGDDGVEAHPVIRRQHERSQLPAVRSARPINPSSISRSLASASALRRRRSSSSSSDILQLLLCFDLCSIQVNHVLRGAGLFASEFGKRLSSSSACIDLRLYQLWAEYRRGN